jgi:benzoyl-CoA reductase/2-hydroxyglutaryl-CoA dehydratase subunit BcrC/BadD/HgdB
MYTELFKLCGFEAEEIEKESPRIDKAFKIAGIGVEDIERAEDRIKKYFDIELIGVRKALGIWLKELIDLVLARNERRSLVYTTFPPVARLGLAAMLASEEVYYHAPEIIMDIVMGQLFGKINPILEAAEEHGMPRGLAMCGLNQARLGALVNGIAPIPDVTLTAGQFCDQSPKTDELIHEIYGVPNIFVDACIDSNWHEYPEISLRRIQYYARELRVGREKLQDVLGLKISEETQREAIRAYGKLWWAMQQIWELNKNDPVPIGQTDLGLFYWMIACPERRALQDGLQVIAILAREVKERVEEGKGVVEKGAPRVAWGVVNVVDPSVTCMFEEVGLAIPVSVFSWISPIEMVKSKFTTSEERTAEAELRYGLSHSTSGTIFRYRECCKDWDVDGLLCAYSYSCRATSFCPLMIKKAVEQELGIPALALECDMYDTRDYSTEALRTRVETFAEMLRAKKVAKK